MPSSFAFAVAAPLAASRSPRLRVDRYQKARWASTPLPTRRAHPRTPVLSPRCCTPSQSPSSSSSSSDSAVVLSTGTIVAVRRNRGGDIDIARVTGGSSSGTTVDVEVLEPFVAELYVPSGKSTYARARDVRAIAAEYAASQAGWIVLDADVRDAETQFRAADAALGDAPKSATPTTVVVEQEKRELSDEALRRQRFRPSKAQALAGAACSVPLAAALFAAYRAAASAYASNPVADDFMSGQLFRAIVQTALAAGSVGSLAVGVGLLLYALSMTDGDSNS